MDAYIHIHMYIYIHMFIYVCIYVYIMIYALVMIWVRLRLFFFSKGTLTIFAKEVPMKSHQYLIPPPSPAAGRSIALMGAGGRFGPLQNLAPSEVTCTGCQPLQAVCSPARPLM